MSHAGVMTVWVEPDCWPVALPLIAEEDDADSRQARRSVLPGEPISHPAPRCRPMRSSNGRASPTARPQAFFPRAAAVDLPMGWLNGQVGGSVAGVKITNAVPCPFVREVRR